MHVIVCPELFQFVFQNNIWNENLGLIAESDSKIYWQHDLKCPSNILKTSINLSRYNLQWGAHQHLNYRTKLVFCSVLFQVACCLSHLIIAHMRLLPQSSHYLLFINHCHNIEYNCFMMQTWSRLISPYLYVCRF